LTKEMKKNNSTLRIEKSLDSFSWQRRLCVHVYKTYNEE
jgi:hypothetical protein